MEPQTKKTPSHATIEVQESGEWIAAADLKETSLGALKEGKELIFNLSNVSHLDASALQILLAVDIEQKKQGRHLHLANVSTDLSPWFQHAGSMERFSMIGRMTNER
ncbi:MAG: STAS domain-containing protein [Acidobacteriaceae bacterium]